MPSGVLSFSIIIRKLVLMGSVNCLWQVYEEALQSVPSARMYELYAEFLIENLEHDDEVDEDESHLNQSAEALLALYQRAEAAGVESETLARGKAGLLLRWGNVDSARETLEVACKGNASARTWTLLLSLQTKSSSVKTKDSSEPISKLLKAALKNASDDVQELLQIVSQCPHQSLMVYIVKTLRCLFGPLKPEH